MTGSTVSFAFVAGTVATVNPCGFALLPAYLARRIGVEDGVRRSADAVSRALVVGAVTTAGFMLVFGTIGTAIGLGARELTRALPWAGLVIGVALALAGAVVLAGGHLRLRLPRPGSRRVGAGLRGDVLFGVGYGTASLSCTLPIFLAATGGAVTGSLAGSAISFLAYAAGMGTILTALAVAAALSQQGLARVLRRLVPYVNRAGGALLLLAGGYVVYYWAYFLWPGSETRTGGRSLIDRGESLSSQAATWLGSDSGQTVASAVLAAVAALVAWALWRWLFHPTRTTSDASIAQDPQPIVAAERRSRGNASTPA
jgi:cytochrome c biogenesis protein CcdA